MPVSRFPCPHCYFSLRIADQRFLGQTVPCPECAGPIFVLTDEDGRMFGLPGDQPLPASLPTQQSTPALHSDSESNPATNPPPAPEWMQASQVQAAPPPKRRRRPKAAPVPTAAPGPTVQMEPEAAPPASRQPNKVWSFLASPLTLAWAFAGGLTFLLVMAILPDGALRRNASSLAEAAGSGATLDAESETETLVGTLGDRNAGPVTTSDRLKEIHRLIASYRATHGHLPGGALYADGVPVEDRFSWQAGLVAMSEADGGPALRPEFAWDHESNERFVRRRQARFLNPSLRILTGGQGYPATHFVGVAGLGEDGPTLDAAHPRAGVFGIDRVTRPDQIVDGLSSTMLVAPVTSGFGSWARSGHATIRPFVSAPYIDGPDGFGSGTPGEMPVLMADGSVRTLSANTDPEVFRRLVTMNGGSPASFRPDGQPVAEAALEPNPPGDPIAGLDPETVPEPPIGVDPRPPVDPNTLTDRRKPTPKPEDNSPILDTLLGPEPTVEPNPQADPDITPEPMPDPEPDAAAEPLPAPVELDAALGQRIRRFDLSEPQPLSDLLDSFGEMLGRPVRFTEDVPEAARGRRVTLTLEDGTVGDILTALVEQAGLELEPTADAILVRPAE